MDSKDPLNTDKFEGAEGTILCKSGERGIQYAQGLSIVWIANRHRCCWERLVLGAPICDAEPTAAVLIFSFWSRTVPVHLRRSAEWTPNIYFQAKRESDSPLFWGSGERLHLYFLLSTFYLNPFAEKFHWYAFPYHLSRPQWTNLRSVVLVVHRVL